VIGLVGKSCALAGACIAPDAMPAIAAATTARRDHFVAGISLLPFFIDRLGREF
jgi:hypothetical protein